GRARAALLARMAARTTRGPGAPNMRVGRWNRGRLERLLPTELGEWLPFAVEREAGARVGRRALHESYELFAAAEGYPAVGETASARHLERLGLRRRGTSFLGARLYAAIPPLRLLTRLEMYGFRFAVSGKDLVWRGPEATSDLERRVIGRHHREIILALTQLE